MSQAICSANFLELWDCDFEAVDDTNHRGAGWSQVGRIRFSSQGDPAKSVPAYLKRQQRYRTRTFAHPINGISTLRREYKMLEWVGGRGVAVARPLYFAEGSQQRALLVVEALQGYTDLDQPLETSRAERKSLIVNAAALVRKLHGLGIYHGCLYPKHLFWNSETGDIRLIDWEKARYSLRRNRTTLRDLDSLNRHALHWSRRERAIFLEGYLGVPVGDPQFKQWWWRLSAKCRSKAG